MIVKPYKILKIATNRLNFRK